MRRGQQRKIPVWMGPASLLGAYGIYIVFMSLLTGEMVFSFGAKGEGLFFVLIFYLPARLILGIAYRYWRRKKSLEVPGNG